MSVPIESLLGGTRNELVESLDWESYRSAPGLNPSTIVKAVRGRDDDGELVLSMKHLKWAWDHWGQGDTDDLLWGRAVHCLLFEPKKFERRYTYFPAQRSTRHKAYQAFLADNPGLEVLSSRQWYAALDAAKSFLGDPKVQALVEEGKSEVTVFKVVDGVQCRGRMDWIRSARLGQVLVDLKSTKSLSPRSFGRDFFAYHYDIKLGLYRRWLSQVTQCQWPVTVIALEKEPPYEVAVIPIGDAVLDYGAEKGLKVIRRVRQCIESGEWPGLFGGEEGYLYVHQNDMEDVELIGAEEVLAA